MYEYLWRNKWLTSDASSIDDMIKSHEVAIEELKKLKRPDIEADFSTASDDYIHFMTDDEKVAKELHFDKLDLEDEDE